MVDVECILSAVSAAWGFPSDLTAYLEGIVMLLYSSLPQFVGFVFKNLHSGKASVWQLAFFAASDEDEYNTNAPCTTISSKHLEHMRALYEQYGVHLTALTGSTYTLWIA